MTYSIDILCILLSTLLTYSVDLYSIDLYSILYIVDSFHFKLSYIYRVPTFTLDSTSALLKNVYQANMSKIKLLSHLLLFHNWIFIIGTTCNSQGSVCPHLCALDNIYCCIASSSSLFKGQSRENNATF